MSACSTEPLPTPFQVVIDTREQLPFTFLGLRADADEQNRPLLVSSVRLALPAGDYSVRGLETQVAIERKSLADLYGTIGQGRDRFEAELHRLETCQFAAVAIEASWPEIVAGPPAHSQLPPKTVFCSILAWDQRFPHVHWWACGNRRLAEIIVFRML